MSVSPHSKYKNGCDHDEDEISTEWGSEASVDVDGISPTSVVKDSVGGGSHRRD